MSFSVFNPNVPNVYFDSCSVSRRIVFLKAKSLELNLQTLFHDVDERKQINESILIDEFMSLLPSFEKNTEFYLSLNVEKGSSVQVDLVRVIKNSLPDAKVFWISSALNGSGDDESAFNEEVLDGTYGKQVIEDLRVEPSRLTDPECWEFLKLETSFILGSEGVGNQIDRHNH